MPDALQSQGFAPSGSSFDFLALASGEASRAQYFLTLLNMSSKNNRPRYNVMVNGGTTDKPFWVRIGAAFDTEKGGLSIKLHANPIEGRIWLFEPKETAVSDKK